MISLIRFFVKRYVFAISIFSAVVFFGVVSGIGVGVNLLPQFDVAVVGITTVYPGGGPEELARQVSEPLERAVATLPGISLVESINAEGVSIVVVSFNDGVDVDQAAVDVNQRISTVFDELPDDASLPTLQKFGPSEEPILNVAVRVPGADIREVQDIASDIVQNRLQRVPGAADVQIVGEVDREVQVLLDPDSLERYSVAPGQIAAAIGNSALDLPAGSLDLQQGRILLTGRNQPNSLADVEEILVDATRGLRVADVATVRDTTETVNSYTRLNGETIVLLEVFKQSDANAVAVASDIRAALADLPLPTGAQAEVVLDSTVFIASSVRDTIREMASAVLIVSLIVLLFVGRLGTVFSVVIAIPISFSGALIAFSLLGFSYNIISLLAITVAVGLVVDDSIVIAENVTRYRDRGYSALESVLKGAGEVSTPVLASTLSLLAVFLPISFLPGILGDIFSEFGLTLAATIVTSYLEAMFFLTVRLAYLPDPYLANWHTFAGSVGKFMTDMRWSVRAYTRIWAYGLMLFVIAGGVLGMRAVAMLTPVTITAVVVVGLVLPFVLGVLRYGLRLVTYFVGALLYSGYQGVDRLFNGLQRGYSRALSGVLSAPAVILIVAFGLFLSLAYVTPRIGFSFTADPDSGQVVVDVELPNTSNLAETNAVMLALENRLRQSPLVTSVQSTVGTGGDDGLTLNTASRASMLVDLIPKNARDVTSAQGAAQLEQLLRAELDQVFTAAQVSASTYDNFGPPETSAFDITIASNDLALLRERDTLGSEIVQAHPSLTNVDSDLSDNVSERVFVLDNAKLVGTGLTAADIYQTLRLYNVGITSGNVRNRGDDLAIRIRANPDLIADEQGLLSLPIFAPASGQALPLAEFGRFEVRQAPTSIYRSGQTYATTISANIAASSDQALTNIRAEVRQQFLDQGVVDGQVTFSQTSAFDLTGDLALYTPIAFLLALILNYLVIASQFNSFRFPLYLMLTIPLAFVGALWLLFLTNSSLDVNSALGLVILIGLVTKNAILLLDVVVSGLQGEHTDLKNALINAGERRLRPIMMTTLTLIAISFPLLFGSGTGSEFRRPLGLIIFGGVTTSALLTLFVVPAAFYLFERKRMAEASGEPQPVKANTPQVTPTFSEVGAD